MENLILPSVRFAFPAESRRIRNVQDEIRFGEERREVRVLFNGTPNWLCVVGDTIRPRKSSIGHSVGRLARKDFRLGYGIDRSDVLRGERTVNGHRLHFHSRVNQGLRRKTVSCHDAPCCISIEASPIR